MNKTDFADYLCQTWPVLTTPEDVLDLGRQLQASWVRIPEETGH